MKRSFLLFAGLVCLFALLLHGIKASNAQGDPAPAERFRTVDVKVTQYVWNVVSNQTGKVLCELIVEEDRQPTEDETLNICSEVIHPYPTSTPLVTSTPALTAQPTQAAFDARTFFASISYRFVEKREFTRVVKIPMQAMVINLRVPPERMANPYILISAYEPEPEYQITAITGKVNGVTFRCAASPCRVSIKTDSVLEFWATSTFGDESEHVNALLRVTLQNNQYGLTLQSLAPIRTFRDACADIWGVPNDPKPDWALFVLTPEDLHTNKKLYYLAEQMIKSGLVDTKDCPGAGLLSGGSVNACGLERAAAEMTRWQNQYDTAIWTSSRDLGVPPKLIKSVMEQESQFWPANSVYYLYEFGLAQINQMGVDVALRWDDELFDQVCNGLLYDCSIAYPNLPPWLQATMRGGLVRSINADCGNCQYGIDFAQAVHSVPTITRVVRANCYQVDQILTENQAGAKYEDLWRFTMVSYHSGYNCISQAIKKTKNASMAIDWANISRELDDSCLGATDYVDNFWKLLNGFNASRIQAEPVPQAEAAFLPTAVPTPSPTPVLARSAIRVIVYEDANNNRQFDPGEGANDIQILVEVEDGAQYTQIVQDGVALFDMKGKKIGARAVISIPVLFRSESVLLPETGEVPVIFRLAAPAVPPVLP